MSLGERPGSPLAIGRRSPGDELSWLAERELQPPHEPKRRRETRGESDPDGCSAAAFLGAFLFLAASHSARPFSSGEPFVSQSILPRRPPFPGPPPLRSCGANRSFPRPPWPVLRFFSPPSQRHTPTLWSRPMDELAARPLPGTEKAQNPFWSPNSRWVGFFSEGKLKKIPAGGGP